MTAWATIGGTGHRPQHLNPAGRHWAQHESARIAVKLRDHHGCTTAISGLALGWDMWWAHAALDAGLVLWAHIPYLSQPDRWNPAEHKMWGELRRQAGKETVYGPNPRSRGEAVRLLHARNGGMISASDAMACLWDRTKRSGGTWNAIQKIYAAGLPAIHLDPGRRTVRLGLPAINGGNRT